MKYVQGLSIYPTELSSRPISAVSRVLGANELSAVQKAPQQENGIDSAPAAVYSPEKETSQENNFKKIGNYSNILNKIRETKQEPGIDAKAEQVREIAERPSAAVSKKAVESYKKFMPEKETPVRPEASENGAKKLQEQNEIREEKSERIKEAREKEQAKKEEAKKAGENEKDNNKNERKVEKQIIVRDDGVYLETKITSNGISTTKSVRIG